jgi:hypothetical protein
MVLMVLSLSSLSQASTIENDEPLLKSLIEQGIICPDLNYEDNQEALRIYLNAKANKNHQPNFDLNKDITNQRQVNKAPKECIRPISVTNTDEGS